MSRQLIRIPVRPFCYFTRGVIVGPIISASMENASCSETSNPESPDDGPKNVGKR